MNSLFSNEKTGTASSQKHLRKLARWEKERNQGKWFWVFRRTSIWTLSLILLFAAIDYFAPEQIDFSSTQFFVVIFMLGGYVIDSLVDWSKMEKLYQSTALTND
ncbi:MAG: hypothetical protein JWN60_285 [Acidobacteria bacterium]|jgi:hypothetical protein|nr:hypothetical protein [Acidobacteriota bacterium]